MSKQNKMSFKQVITQEYEIIIFFAVALFIIPIITEIIVLSDFIRLNSLSALEKLGALIGISQFSFTNTDILSILSIIVCVIVAAILPWVMAKKLNGYGLLDSIKEGVKAFGEVRTWRYIGFVYVPFFVVMTIVVLVLNLIPATQVLSIVQALAESTVLLIIAIILLMVISIVLTTIGGIFIVANIAYARGDAEIKQAFNSIPSREINKILIFNVADTVTAVLIVLVFGVAAMTMAPLALLASIISMIIGLIIALIIFQVIFITIRISLYMNVGSKIEVGSNQKVIEANDRVLVAEAEEATKPELTIQPKMAKRQHRITPEKPERVKPKRNI